MPDGQVKVWKGPASVFNQSGEKMEVKNRLVEGLSQHCPQTQERSSSK